LRPAHEKEEYREEGDDGQSTQRQQPGGADGADGRKLQIVADEKCKRDVGPLIETVNRRNHDPERDEGPGRDEIGGEQHAVE
jgi:hypothetical protein